MTTTRADIALPRGARARRDARRRPVDAARAPTAAAARSPARLPRLLVAGRAPCGDGALVHLPRADLRPFRRLELALPVPRRGVPGLSRIRRAEDAAGEPVLPRAAGPLRGGGPGADRDHGAAGRAWRVRRARGASLVPARPLLRAAARPRGDDGSDLDRAERLLLRALPLAPVRAPGREELPHRRLPAPDAERALAVPGLRGCDLARGADRAQAHAGRVPGARRGLRLRVRRRGHPGRLHHGALLRRLLH